MIPRIVVHAMCQQDVDLSRKFYGDMAQVSSLDGMRQRLLFPDSIVSKQVMRRHSNVCN